MKPVVVFLALASILTACNASVPVASRPLTAAAPQAQAAAKGPIGIVSGLTLRYAVTGQRAGYTVTASHRQDLVSTSSRSAKIRHTVQDKYGAPMSFDETVALSPGLVSDRWTSQALPLTAPDPATGQPDTITVKAGTYRTRRVFAAADGMTGTWWFAGDVPVRVVLTGLPPESWWFRNNLPLKAVSGEALHGRMDVTAELTGF